jgi:hypothetical protein
VRDRAGHERYLSLSFFLFVILFFRNVILLFYLFLQKNKTFFFGSNFFLAHIQGVRFETILREI